MEKLFAKYFFIVVLTTLGTVSFFFASGINELAAGTLLELLSTDEDGDLEGSNKVPRKRPSKESSLDGSAIVSRNIFDSTATLVEPEPEPDEPPLSEDGEYILTHCDIPGLKLLATIASSREPDWSFANVEVSGNKQLFRMGDSVSGRTISGITWRYLILRGTIDECYIDMFDQDGRNRQPPRQAQQRQAAEVTDSRISVESEFERTVDRSIVDQALANPTRFAQSVRVRPFRQDGEVVGFRMRTIQKGSAIEQLGAMQGDVLHAVNGIDLKSVDDALSAYQNLRSENQLVFSVTRRGKPVDLKINIK